MTTMTQPYSKSSTTQLVANFFERLFSQRSSGRAYLDVRDLPDHLKRDLGFLEGRDPSGSVR